MIKSAKHLVAFICNSLIVTLTVYTYVLLFSPDAITFGTAALIGLWAVPVILSVALLFALLALFVVVMPLSLHESYHTKRAKRTVSN